MLTSYSERSIVLTWQDTLTYADRNDGVARLIVTPTEAHFFRVLGVRCEVCAEVGGRTVAEFDDRMKNAISLYCKTGIRQASTLSSYLMAVYGVESA